MTAGSTYTPIATTTLGSAAASYTFSSIAGTYTDLILIYSGNGTSVNTQGLRLRVNSDTGTNYSYTYIRGDGTSATSSRATSTTFASLISNTTNSGISNAIAQFQNYSNATTYKTILVRGNDASARTEAFVNLWRNTAAITSITIIPESGTINSGSTFTLYGIAAA